MKKSILLLVSLILVSCGSIKKDKTSIETEKESELNQGSNTARWINSSNWGLEPQDPLKPMVFTNSKGEIETYHNTKIYHNNTHTKEIVNDTIVKKEKEKQDINIKNKETDNTMLILGLFGLFLLFLFGLILFIVLRFEKKISLVAQLLEKKP